MICYVCEVKSLGTVFYVVLFSFLCISRYWSQETQKGHPPKLYKAIIRILWWKLLVNFLLAALKVSAINVISCLPTYVGPGYSVVVSL